MNRDVHPITRLTIALGVAALSLILLFSILNSAGFAAPLNNSGSASPTVTFTIQGLDAPPVSVIPFSVTVQATFTDTDTLLRYRIVVLQDGAPLAGQQVYYPEAGDPLDAPAQWSHFTTDEDGEAFFGPAGGFSLEMLPELADPGVTTPFWTRLGMGAYTLALRLEEITGTVRGAITHTFMVQDVIVFDFTGLEGRLISGTLPFTITARVTETRGISTTPPITTWLRYRAQVSHAGAPLAGQVISYTGGSFETDAEGIAWFGPASGFRLADLPALATTGITTPFESTLAPRIYTLTVGLMDISEGQPAAKSLGMGTQVFEIFEPFSLVTNTEGQGAIAVDPNWDIYIRGDVVTLTAQAASGWIFTGWSGDYITITNPLAIQITGNTDITAAFTLMTHTLTIATTGNGSGTITPTVGTHVYDYGTVVTLTATPAPDSTFAGWSGDPDCANGLVTMDADKSCTATFALNTYVITPTAGVGGSILPTTPQTVTHGDDITFTIAANPGCHIVDVGVDGLSQGALSSYTFVNVTADHTLTATFALNTYVITPTAGVGGSILPATPQTVTHGDDITFTIAVNTGYHLVDVGVDGLSQGALRIYTFVNVTADHTLTATFAQDAYTLTVDIVGNGTVLQSPDQATYVYGEVVTLTAQAEVGWTFEDWSSDLGAAEEITITITGNTEITAIFTQDEYELEVNTVGEGTVIQDPEQATYVYGDVITLTAQVAHGWAFTGWSGDITSTNTTHIFTITQNTVVTVTFIQYRIYLPLVTNNYVRLTNGDFGQGLLGWQVLSGGFIHNGVSYGSAGPQPQPIMVDGRNVARLGDLSYVNGHIPVGYGAIAQTFTIEGDTLSFDYRLVTQDLYQGTAGYYDTFEVSINTAPGVVSNQQREMICNEGPQAFNPENDSSIPVSAGLVLCAGRVNIADAGDFGWRTVTLTGLNDFSRDSSDKNMTLYFSIWSRQYTGFNQGWWNTYVEIDNVRW